MMVLRNTAARTTLRFIAKPHVDARPMDTGNLGHRGRPAKTLNDE